MPPPPPDQVVRIFNHLSERPDGHKTFFSHVSDTVQWEVTGHNAFSGTWTSKEQFLNDVWLPILSGIAEPGPKLDLVSKPIISFSGNWVVVELKTSDTKTKHGGTPYHQHYCWLCQFDSNERIAHVKAFLDSSSAEKVLGEERSRRGLLTKVAENESLMAQPEYPALAFDRAYKQFLQRFYELADIKHEHEQYVSCFTPDATLVLGTRRITGRQGIYELRQTMWDTVKRRTHRLLQVFPHGPRSNLAMVHGVVRYEFYDGGSKTVDWAARCHFLKTDDGVFLERYQVYLADAVN